MKRISILSDGFEQRSFFKRLSMKWSELIGISGVSINKITYSELFLNFSGKNNTIIVVGEFDDGFYDLEAALKDKIEDFPKNWRSMIEADSSNEFRNLWLR